MRLNHPELMHKHAAHLAGQAVVREGSVQVNHLKLMCSCSRRLASPQEWPTVIPSLYCRPTMLLVHYGTRFTRCSMRVEVVL